MNGDDDDDIPMLPYAGTSGWSGSDTSKARAERDDAEGVTGRRQRAVLDLAARAGSNGITWRETADALDVHHGAASGALSVLHKEGRLNRLAQVRERAKIYVLPVYADGRPIEPMGRHAPGPMLAEAIRLLRSQVSCAHNAPVEGCWSCQARSLIHRYEQR